MRRRNQRHGLRDAGEPLFFLGYFFALSGRVLVQRVQGRHARACCIGPRRANHLGARRPQTPARPKRIVVRLVFYCRAVCRGSGAVEGFPWPGRRRGRAGSGAAPLACIWPLRFSVLGRPRKVISARSCVKARPRSARCCAALTPARSDWASRRKPTVSLDVISLVASSCGYYRGQIEQRAAHEFAMYLAT